MHSKIFQLTSKKLKVSERATSYHYDEDSLVCYWCDYIGDEVTDRDERRDYIEGFVECFRDFIESFDIRTGRVTFLPAEKCREVVVAWLKESAGQIMAFADKFDSLTQYSSYAIIQRYHDIHSIIDTEYSGTQLSGSFVSDLASEGMDRTQYIGGIVDFHW